MRHIFQSVFKDGQGRIIPSATVSVYLAGTVTAANVYAAATGGSPVTSVTTSSDGSFSFFVSDSDFSLNQRFKITMTKTDFATKSYDNITIFAPVPTGVYYPDANATDQGAATTGGYSLKDIIDAAGSNNITIKFRNSSGSATTSYTLTTSETIPANCAIEFEIGARIVQGGSATLTINAPVVGNPMHKWLSGFAASEILGLKEAKVEWFGAVADGTTDNSTALQLAFDWWMYGSNRHLSMRGDYRANSQLNIYSPSGIAAHNCVLSAYGAKISSYVNGKALVIGTDGTETGATDGTSVSRNCFAGLKIEGMSTNTTTLLKLAGHAVFDNVFPDITLRGYDSVATPTVQGLLIYGAICYYNEFTSLRVIDCERLISINRDHVAGTDLTVALRSNANRINGVTLYGAGTTSIYMQYTTGNKFTGVDCTNGYTATEDVYFGTQANDNHVAGRFESGATYTHTLASGVTGNYYESQLTMNVNAADAEQRNNVQVKTSSTNNRFYINQLRTRYLYNHTGQPWSIVVDNYNSGNSAIYIDSTGITVPSLIISGDTGGDTATGAITLTAVKETAGGAATTLPTADATHGPSDVTGDGWIKLYVGTGAGTQVIWIPYWND